MARHYEDGLALRVLFFFARNPSEELDITDIAEKFGHEATKVNARLEWAVRRGHLAKKPGKRGRAGESTVYTAGERMIVSIFGCMPVATSSAVEIEACVRMVEMANRPAAVA